jgi:cobalamin-dependent methionine synthase I
MAKKVTITGNTENHSCLQCMHLFAGIDINNMKGQGYDGASNMSGAYKGVQARIRERIPDAVYSHCKAHCLNLAIVHSCKVGFVRNMMDVVQTIAFAFSYSAKRLDQYKQTLEGDPESLEQMQERRHLQNLCETRWAARADALTTFLASFRYLLLLFQLSSYLIY